MPTQRQTIINKINALVAEYSIARTVISDGRICEIDRNNDTWQCRIMVDDVVWDWKHTELNTLLDMGIEHANARFDNLKPEDWTSGMVDRFAEVKQMLFQQGLITEEQLTEMPAQDI